MYYLFLNQKMTGTYAYERDAMAVYLYSINYKAGDTITLLKQQEIVFQATLTPQGWTYHEDKTIYHWKPNYKKITH